VADGLKGRPARAECGHIVAAEGALAAAERRPVARKAGARVAAAGVRPHAGLRAAIHPEEIDMDERAQAALFAAAGFFRGFALRADAAVSARIHGRVLFCLLISLSRHGRA